MAETSVSYKCPRCGAPLSFLPGRDTVSCEYCGTEFEIAAIEAMFAREQEAARRAAEIREAEFDTAAAGGEWSPEESGAMVIGTRRRFPRALYPDCRHEQCAPGKQGRRLPR